MKLVQLRAERSAVHGADNVVRVSVKKELYKDLAKQIHEISIQYYEGGNLHDHISKAVCET